MNPLSTEYEQNLGNLVGDAFEDESCDRLRGVFSDFDAARLVDPGQRSRVSKFQPCLPPDIEHGLIARETMSVEDANATLALWTSGSNQEVEE